MIINAAVASGRKVSLDGRSMIGYVEIAVRQGILKVPKGSIIPMQQTINLEDSKLLIMCTGGQGEPNAALQRMSQGDHKYIKLKQGDTVVISSSPIPGNEVSYDQISNRLSRSGAYLFRHPTHELDGCGPLHVSGHARRDELREMLQLIRPIFFIPVHAGSLRRRYHGELGIEEGVPRKNVILPENGDSYHFTRDSVEPGAKISTGSLLVDQTGSVVSGIVIKDRLMLSEEGILAVILTIDGRSGRLVNSPDVISRGFIAMRDSTDLMKLFRSELNRAVQQRFRRVDNDRFKAEIRDFTTHFLFDKTGHSPIVIPVINIVNGQKSRNTKSDSKPVKDKQEIDNQRFKEMRDNLLSKVTRE
jgi:ribonuclease J